MDPGKMVSPNLKFYIGAYATPKNDGSVSLIQTKLRHLPSVVG
jgi:hypothetical protein